MCVCTRACAGVHTYIHLHLPSGTLAQPSGSSPRLLHFPPSSSSLPCLPLPCPAGISLAVDNRPQPLHGTGGDHNIFLNAFCGLSPAKVFRQFGKLVPAPASRAVHVPWRRGTPRAPSLLRIWHCCGSLEDPVLG